jgi:hypothetical protein
MDPPAAIPRFRDKKKVEVLGKRAYLLSRGGAECLARQLTSRPRKAKEFQWDEAGC